MVLAEESRKADIQTQPRSRGAAIDGNEPNADLVFQVDDPRCGESSPAAC